MTSILLSLNMALIPSAYGESILNSFEAYEMIKEKSPFIRSLKDLHLWEETDQFWIYRTLVELNEGEKRQRDLFAYISKSNPFEDIYLRLHNFVNFPFPEISSADYFDIKNNPDQLSISLTPFAGEEYSQDLQKLFINSLTADFGTTKERKDVFYHEKELFNEFQNLYIHKLEQIQEWNQVAFKHQNGIPGYSFPISLHEDDENFRYYFNLLSSMGMDFALPYVVGSDCKECFSLIGSFSPNDNLSGFFWINDEQYLPPLSPHDVYFFEALGDGWYIFLSS